MCVCLLLLDRLHKGEFISADLVHPIGPEVVVVNVDVGVTIRHWDLNGIVDIAVWNRKNCWVRVYGVNLWPRTEVIFIRWSSSISASLPQDVLIIVQFGFLYLMRRILVHLDDIEQGVVNPP